MKNSIFSYNFIIVIILTIIVSSLLTSAFGASLVYSTSSFSQSLQQSQNELQSAINKEVQQTIANTISDINNSISDSNKNGSNDSRIQNITSLSAFQQKASMIDNISSQKVRVGDIDIAYKILGDGNRTLVLVTGLGATMDMWSPYLINNLTAAPNNYKIILFDNRGAGESTIGTKNFSINQFTNDTIGLLDALNIKKADIMGWSMGSIISQELAAKHPDRVNSLILYASSCGGPDAAPPTPEVTSTFSNTSPTPKEFAQKSIELLFPTLWFKANPNYVNYFPIPTESVSSKVMEMQTKALEEWSGDCNILGNIVSPTLVIVGTDDFFTPSANSMKIVQEIPGAWLAQIKDAGHGLMYQYPEIFTEVVETFLNTAGDNMM